MKHRNLLISAVVIVATLAGASVQAQTKYNLTLTGASPKGLWSLLGAGINSALATAYPGSSVTYQTSGGGLANVGIVSNGKAEMGIVHNIELKVAAAGGAPFDKPVTNLKAIAYVYNWAPMQLVLTKAFADKYAITSISDIKKNKAPVRFAVNQRGNMVQEVNKQILDAYGISYDDVKSWGGQIVYAASKQMGGLMSDRRIDMLGNGVFAPHKSILKVGSSQPVIMLPLSDDAITKVAASTGADPYTIKAGAYEWLDNDIKTVALGAELVVSDAMSTEDAYNITKALIENVDKIQGVHKAMQALTPQLMASQNVIAYHPGALKYYKEAGLIK